MPEVGRRHDHLATRHQRRAHRPEELDRLADVLDDVGGDDDVERAAELGEATVEVPEAEVVDPVADAGLFHDVDAGHVVAEVTHLLGQQAGRAPDVEDLLSRPDRSDGFEDRRVRRVVVGLEAVAVLVGNPAGGAESELGRAVLHDVADHVPGVLHAVDVADLVAVVGGDRDLDDAPAGVDQLHDDLGVEVEVVGVLLERDRRQCGDGVRPVPGVELGELGAEQRVLHPRQDLVAGELVERHAATARRAPLEHARPEHRVGIAVDDRPHDVGQALRGVLAVGMEHHHDVETALDRHAVAGLLVAAVAAVLEVADRR